MSAIEVRWTYSHVVERSSVHVSPVRLHDAEL